MCVKVGDYIIINRTAIIVAMLQCTVRQSNQRLGVNTRLHCTYRAPVSADNVYRLVVVHVCFIV